ncbi:MAG: RagB/SusD family nutrient uptake outer membrane protein [Muribaculaceae bacterium]|nr:RagB/SusD family nutrient uptake outer membrane protein [Muribaculaceae bacterium]MDE6523611.1 RagB/SusD family nutrient uptake outer membrane protein [Muribaculaceae bacterium]
MKKLIYTLALGAALGLSSCGSDFLGTPTDSRVELDSTDKLRMLLASSYPNYNYAWPCELMSDNMEDNNAPDEDGLRYNLSAYDRGDEEMFRWQVCLSNTSSDSPSGIWESNYNAIAGANAVLEVLEKWEKEGPLDAQQRAVKGEALMIRSYCHFMLAQIFCHPYRGDVDSESLLGIPYIKKPETTVKPNYTRGNLKETYDNIRADLEAALPLIDNSIYEIPKYHFNKTAADAYAARFYLFTREYDKCLEHCNSAFGGENVDPGIYLSTIFQNLGNFYYIYDFGKFNQGSDKARNFMLIATYSQAWRHFAASSRFGVIRDALNSTIHGSSPSWSRFQWRLTNGKGSTFVMHPCFNGSCGSNGKSEYGSYYAGNISEQFEYTDKVAGIGYTHVTRSEFTGEEVLFTRAEAKLFLGDIQGAVDDISIWEKSRRNCPGAEGSEDLFKDLTIANIREFYADNDPGYGIAKTINIDQICPSKWSVSGNDALGVLQCIQHFRRIEMIHTGMRWFDIKRLGLEFDRKIGKDEVDHLGIFDERKAVQIPAEIVAAGMQSNPRPNVEDTKVTPSSAYEAVRN